MALTSKIIFCKNIKMDRNNLNVLTYSESDMLTLVNSTGIKLAESTDYSFIGKGDRDLIDVQLTSTLTYQVLLQCNYIAFQNTNYCNKWYFAFVDRIQYINDGVARIHYTVDIFATWWSYWSPKACFISREHVMDDTIGKHTIPEQLETGDYIQQNIGPFGGVDLWVNYLSDFQFVVALSEWPFEQALASAKYYNGLYSGLKYLAFNNAVYLGNFLLDIQDESTGDPVYSIFVVPQFITGLDSEDFDYIVSGHTSWKAAWVPEILHSSSISDDIRIADAHIIDQDYVPVNNKLLVYPYRYILINNNAGSSAEYRYEWFYDRGLINNYETCKFKISGTISPGCNIKIYPTGYGKYNIGATNKNLLFSLDGGKLPTCCWLNDPYVNWLTQNAVNMPLQALGNIAKIAGGLAGNFTGALSGISGIASQVGEIYTHGLEPNTAKGGVNQGDLNCSDNIGFSWYRMSIKKEFAIVIDNFLSKFGYQVNITKLPNQTGRTNWNYVQTGPDEILCYQKTDVLAIPAQDLVNINKLYNRGITLWHSHTNLGDYTQSNNIVNPPTP